MNRRWVWTLLSLSVVLTVPPLGIAATFRVSAGDVAGLIAAIHAGNDEGTHPGPDTIRLAAGAYTLTTPDNDSDGPTGLPSITSKMTLRGAGAATTIIERGGGVCAGTPMRLLHVAASGNLRLEALTLQRGLLDEGRDGAGIHNRGALLVRFATIKENCFDYDGAGAGVFNNGGVVTIRHSTIVRNFAGQGFGGGVSNSLGGTLLIEHSTLMENGAETGGGISNLGTLTMTHSTLSDNHGQIASALSNRNGATAWIRKTTISQNENSVVGAITNTGAMIVRASTITDNASGDCGGFANLGGTLEIHGSTLQGNGREGQLSGGLCNSVGGAVRIERSTITGNLSSGVYNAPDFGPSDKGAGSILIRHTLISGHSATSGDGGGIVNMEGIVTIQDSVITDNETVGNGGIYNDGIMSLQRSTVSNNEAGSDGGGIFNTGTLTLKATTVRGNTPNECTGCPGALLVGAVP